MEPARREPSASAWSQGNARPAAALIALVLLLGSGRALADGAIAIGLPGDVAKQGVAIGTSWNYPSGDAAKARAMQECLSFQDAPADTRKLCKVIQTFKRECVAVAIDPEAGTPGVGWAVAAAKGGAEETAMRNCRNTAGKSRQQFCKVTVTHCDGQ